MIRIQCLHGAHEGRVFEFDEPSVTVGRGPQCDFRLDDPACSSVHARIEAVDETYRVTDLGSTNGILVNGKRTESSEIHYGDRIALGRNLFIFLTEFPTTQERSGEIRDTCILDTVSTEDAEKRLIRQRDTDDGSDASPEPSDTGAVAELQRRNHQMRVLHRLSSGVSKTLELDHLYTFIAESLTENIPAAERACIYLQDPTTSSMLLVRSHPRGDGGEQGASRSILRHVAKERVGVLASDIASDERFCPTESMEISHLHSFICVPLLVSGKLLGAIYLENCQRAAFSKDDLELLTVAGNQVAASIENALLYDELRSSFYETVRTLCNTLEAKDRYTRGHSDRVARYAVGIGRELGLAPRRLENLRIAAELHDIGKIAIQEAIINKNARLTDDEYETVKEHCRLGIRILEPVRFLKPILPMVLHHHERYDGSGYPDGLRGDAIPLESRILNLADAFDAMTTQRPYNRPKTFDEALRTCEGEAGSSFDPDCVRALRSHLENRGRKTTVVRATASAAP